MTCLLWIVQVNWMRCLTSDPETLKALKINKDL